MPGSITSMPYLAVPLVLEGMSSCGTDTPIMVYWSGVFSLIAFSSSGVKVLVALPLFTTSANDICFFDFGCEITESRTTSSDGRHAHRGGRAFRQCRPSGCAGPAAIASKFIMVDQLPPVICAPSTGSLNFGSLEASCDAHVASTSRRAPRRRSAPWWRRCAGPCRPCRRSR